MNRRHLLKAGAAALAAGALAPRLGARAANAALPTAPAPGPKSPPPYRSAGIRMIPVAGGKHRVWTKKVGRGATKVLLLHGGPGFTHEVFECFEDFLPAAGVEFYYYDQLGSHYSDQPDDDSLWTLARFTEEVEEVRRGLGLDKFVLYGQSWGGMLGIEYGLKYGQHLRGLVLSNMTAGVQAYVAHAKELLAQLPEAARSRLAELEAKGDYANPDYEKLMMSEIYPRHVCRLEPWPEPVLRGFKHFNQHIYNLMQGPSEFTIIGNLKGWERWDELHRIATPTLVIGAQHDEMDPEQLKKMATLMPKAKFRLCPNGSHLAMWDDQEVYFRHLLAFLKEVA